MCLAGWPVLSGIAPTVEALTESLINMTPLKPSPEEVRERERERGKAGVLACGCLPRVGCSS